MTPEQASNLLKDDYFLAELDKIHQTQIDAICTSAEHDVDVRENAYRMIKALALIRNHFQSIVDTAEMKKRKWKVL